MKKIIHNVETNEILEFELTAEELAQAEKDQLRTDARIEAEKQAAAEAAAARAALLAKLGITEEEAKLLLGGN